MIALEPTAFTQPVPAAPIQKEHHVRNMMREAGRVLVAYSGGVDHAYLSLLATEEIGSNAICILDISPSCPSISGRKPKNSQASSSSLS
ncbi:MAG: hypothetical protein ABR535_02025 [Pyrinomonadaceae bacterium]